VIFVENSLIKPAKAYLRKGLSFPFSCKSDFSVKWYYLRHLSQSIMKKINIYEFTPKKQPPKGLYRCEGHKLIDNQQYHFYADGVLIHSSKLS